MDASSYDIDELVKINKLQEVTSPVIFERGGAPHPNGLLSTVIFGNGVKERRVTHAYIDLVAHFFTASAFIAMKTLFRKVDRVIGGMEYVKLVDGKITICSAEDPDAETGISFFYDHWEKIKWERSEDASSKRNELIDFLTLHKKSEIFHSKLLVLPVFYRDIQTESSSSTVSNDELNDFYCQIIRFVSMIRTEDMFSITFYSTYLKIQNLILDIYNYFKLKLEKKNGLIRRYLLGKNTAFAVRSVITGATYHAEYAKDMIAKIDQIPVPLAQCVAELYPFIIKWLRDFFEDRVVNRMVIRRSEDGKNFNLKNSSLRFNDKFYEQMCKRYIKDPSSRFDILYAETEDNKLHPLILSGRKIDQSNNSENPQFNRALTYTDVLYMAAYEAVNGKHVLSTRYPVLDHTGTYPARVFVLSTIKTMPILINGTVYNHYPVVEPDTKKSDIAALFCDSMMIAPSMLPRMDGDFDGDQITGKMPWSQEANEECSELLNNKRFLLNVSSNLTAGLESEAVQTLFVMSKDPEDYNRRITDEEQMELINHDINKFSFTYLISLFGNKKKTKDRFDRQIEKARFKCNDIMELNAKESPTGVKMTTTVGRFIIYRVLIEFCKLTDIVPYINKRIDNKVYNSMDSMVGDALMKNKISMDTMKDYINQRDWFTFSLHAVVCASYSPKVIKTPKEVVELRDSLVKKYKKELESGNIDVSDNIEQALIKRMKEVMGNDYGMDLYISGARGSIGNNLKDINLFKGAVINPFTGKYDIVTSNFMDGIRKQDIAASANANVAGAYPKACGTAISGYLGKQMIALLQTYVLGSRDSDCGSVGYVDLVMTEDFVRNKLFLYRYIKEGDKLIMLTEDNIEKYIGKRVKLRSPMYCKKVENGKLCNKCCGDQYYEQDIDTVGLLSMRVAGTLTNANMKKFHSNQIKIARFDLDKLLI